MAINWDVSKIDKWNTTCYREVGKTELKEEEEENKEKPNMVKLFALPRYTENGKVYEMSMITWNLQFSMCLSLGIGEITQKNYEQVFSRITFQEQLNGCVLKVDGKDYLTTIEDVKNHIGLKVNASLKTPAQFVKGVVGAWKRGCKLEF